MGTSERDQERLNRERNMAMRLGTLYRDIAAFNDYVSQRKGANEDDTAVQMLSRIELQLRILFGKPDPVLPNDDPDISRPQVARTPEGKPLSPRASAGGSISGSTQPASDTYACPYCRETMKVTHVP